MPAKKAAPAKGPAATTSAEPVGRPGPQLSFDAWKAQQPPERKGPLAWIQKIPEFEQCCELYRRGERAVRIREWLASGYGSALANEAKVDNWLQTHVKRDARPRR